MKCEVYPNYSWNEWKLILSISKRRQMLQTDPSTVASGWYGKWDRMCWGEAWAFVATQPTGPEPWPLTLHPGGQTKLWVTSETRHSVGRECLDRTQVTPLTLQKRFMAFYFAPVNLGAGESHRFVKNNQENWRCALGFCILFTCQRLHLARR